jgi:hypothetical protein
MLAILASVRDRRGESSSRIRVSAFWPIVARRRNIVAPQTLIDRASSSIVLPSIAQIYAPTPEKAPETKARNPSVRKITHLAGNPAPTPKKAPETKAPEPVIAGNPAPRMFVTTR